MSNMLILGGTGWLGAETARQALAAGHNVTCIARGESGTAPEGAIFVRADRTQPGALDDVAGEWDAVIEFAYEPAPVRAALDAFADRTAHWSLVSTVSVYASHDRPGADESAELVDPVDLDEYGQAKVAAEQLSRERLGDRLLITRPGLIVGPGDPTDRFSYWPARLERGGVVLAPEMQGHVQVIDVADLAAWLLRSAEVGLTGTVDAVGASIPMREFFALASREAGFDGTIIDASHDWLRSQGVQHWAGPRSLPLWLPTADAALTQRSHARFLELGGRLRPLAATIRAVATDERARGIDRARRSGLTPAEERELLSLWTAAVSD